MHISPSTIVVSGIQSSGALHIGNYFGAIRQHIAFQTAPEAYYFIVNYHAMTSMRDADLLRRHTLDAAITYLALGLDPSRANLFVQSDIPVLQELTWIFYCLTPVSQLEKGVSYKDKVSHGLPANAGLLCYPVLQASDILIYGGTLVPVGADQKQHLEITRDIAIRFNHLYPANPPIFPVPDPYIVEDVAVVPGTDGRKMSKSYGNTIGIFEEGRQLRKRIRGIVTDSTPLEAPKDPDTDNVFALLKLFADPDTLQEIADAYRAGGYGYGHAKAKLASLMIDYFADARQRRKELECRPDYVMDVLRQGARNALARAEPLMERVRSVTGLMTTIGR